MAHLKLTPAMKFRRDAIDVVRVALLADAHHQHEDPNIDHGLLSLRVGSTRDAVEGPIAAPLQTAKPAQFVLHGLAQRFRIGRVAEVVNLIEQPLLDGFASDFCQCRAGARGP